MEATGTSQNSAVERAAIRRDIGVVSVSYRRRGLARLQIAPQIRPCLEHCGRRNGGDDRRRHHRRGGNRPGESPAGLRDCPDTKLVALCDANPQVLEEARKKTGIQTVETDYRKLIARDDVQAVVIATPNHVHAPMALAAIEAGKHVLCEKPIAMNFAEAKRMYEAAETRGVRHMTAFTYRFVPAMRYMAHLSKGSIGRPYHFRASAIPGLGRPVSRLAADQGDSGDRRDGRHAFPSDRLRACAAGRGSPAGRQDTAIHRHARR